jgi:hypothetical protein
MRTVRFRTSYFYAIDFYSGHLYNNNNKYVIDTESD